MLCDGCQGDMGKSDDTRQKAPHVSDWLSRLVRLAARRCAITRQHEGGVI